MSKKSYRDILTRYIQEHKVEDAILTDQVVQYAAEELGKDAAEVKKAVNVTMARLEKMNMLSDWLRVYIARR